MAICGKCGAENTRIRTTFHTDREGKYISHSDECPSCAPNSFEPQWKRDKIVPAYEAYPTRYRRSYLEDGRVSYTATEEARADGEAKILMPNADDVAAKQRAIERRRAWAKDQPRKLTQAQIESINSRRDELLASPMARVAGVHRSEE